MICYHLYRGQDKIVNNAHYNLIKTSGGQNAADSRAMTMFGV